MDKFTNFKRTHAHIIATLREATALLSLLLPTPPSPRNVAQVTVRVMEIDKFMNSKRLFKDVRRRPKAQQGARTSVGISFKGKH